ncbi:MAG: hypothetical protein ABIV10_07670 [Gemmatimonadaceae bacterium]
MNDHLTCAEFEARLAQYWDDDLPATSRLACDMHASNCADCERLLSDVAALRDQAASLPPIQPSRDLWAGIAERIDARVLPFEAPRAVAFAASRRAWRHPAVAAAALVLFTAGVTHLWTRRSFERPLLVAAVAPTIVAPLAATSEPPQIADPSPEVVATSSPAPARAETRTETRAVRERGAPFGGTTRAMAEARATLVSNPARAVGTPDVGGEPVYDREIVKLRAIVRERRSQLDPATVAVLEQSIAVIDSAIAQSRAALARDPASGFLVTRLNHSLEKKVELLRTAALLPART